MAPAPVDLDQLVAFTEGDLALERELASLYLRTARRYLAAMRAAAPGSRGFEDAAHALKGASANLGAHVVAAQAAAAERGEHATNWHASLKTALEEVAAFFQSRHQPRQPDRP